MALRAGLIGCGGISRLHVRGYQDLGIEVVALADISRPAVMAVAEEAPRAEIFSEAKDLLDSGLVDVISICTPPAFHEETSIYAMRKGIHVLCEKPFAHTLEAASRIAAVSNESSALFMCGFRHRFLPAVLKMRGLLADVGPLVFFNNVFCGPQFNIKDTWFAQPKISGGGVMIDTMPHSIDLFRFLVGEVIDQKVQFHRHLPDIQPEDTAILSLKAENGTVGSITASWVAGAPIAVIDLVGQKGRVAFDYDRPAEVRLKLLSEPDWRQMPVEPSNGFGDEIAHFVGAIRGENALTCTAKDALRTMEILEAGLRPATDHTIEFEKKAL